jgi:hypothetical protein
VKWDKDLDARTKLAIVTNGDLADIKHRAVEVEEYPLPKFYV